MPGSSINMMEQKYHGEECRKYNGNTMEIQWKYNGNTVEIQYIDQIVNII
jgi:hypothetical protein